MNLLDRLNNFKKNIETSRNLLLQNYFDKKWFDIVKNDIEKFYINNKHRENPIYSTLVGGPFIWFNDEQEFERLNTAIKRIYRVNKKKKYLRNKVNLISKSYKKEISEQQNRWSSIFEILAISKFIDIHKDLKVLDIEFKHKQFSKSNVDALIEIIGKKALVETTLIYKNIRMSPTEIKEEIYEKKGIKLDSNYSVGVLGIDEMEKQVIYKIEEKIKQIGNVNVPTILIIGLPPIGPDSFISRLAIQNIYKKDEAKGITCIIIALSFLFIKGYSYFNQNAKYPFNDNEKSILEKIF